MLKITTYRFIGEDIKEGEVLIDKGDEFLIFLHITLLASRYFTYKSL